MNGHNTIRGLAAGASNSKGVQHQHSNGNGNGLTGGGSIIISSSGGGGGKKKAHEHDGSVPTLCIQPETPVPPPCRNTPVPLKVEPGGALPALSSARSLINGGHPSPSPQPSPRFGGLASQGFEPKPYGGSCAGSSGGLHQRGKCASLGRGAGNGFHSDVKTGASLSSLPCPSPPSPPSF